MGRREARRIYEWVNLWRRYHLGDQCANHKKILKWILWSEYVDEIENDSGLGSMA
jgi:hypothetical protein